jgi:uncharacterized delta-60 repeat protein
MKSFFSDLVFFKIQICPSNLSIEALIKKIFFSFLFLFLTAPVYSQGGVDLTFNSSDTGFGNGDGLDYYAYTMSIQTDGKIVVGGVFQYYNERSRNYLIRLTSDGLLDNSFLATGTNNYVLTTALQGDGKIIAGGQFTSCSGAARNYIARLNTDGSIDNSFNPGTGANDYVKTSAVQSDGKIIIGGNFTSYNGTAVNHIARLNSDGTLDGSFNIGTGADDEIRTIAIQANGKIIIGGYFTSYNSISRNRVAGLDTDGTLDPSFDPGTGANSFVYSSIIQSDGQIIIAGNFSSYNGSSSNSIARLNTNGSVDASFNAGTGAGSNNIMTVSLQSDGKVIAGGDFTSFNGIAKNRVVRLYSDGSLDNSFNTGTGASNYVWCTAVQSDDNVIIGGGFYSYDVYLASCITRLLATDGSHDDTFNPSKAANGSIYALMLQNDGKIIISGFFFAYDGILRRYIARTNADGSLDYSFDPGIGANDYIYSMALQSDEKIVIGGWFTTYNGLSRNCVARLNTDGSLDASFNPGTGANSYIYSVVLQGNGSIIIGGNFTSYNGTARSGIARLNTDGSLDTSFDPGTGANGIVNISAVQSDGAIIIGGEFTSYNGVAVNHIARLNLDGSLDNSFNVGTGTDDDVETIVIQSDGKILIGGRFNNYNGTNSSGIARINTDGSFDNSFNVGAGVNSLILTISVQSTGEIIAGGYFSFYNLTMPRNSILRLNQDGSLDNSFAPGSGIQSYVRATAIQSDGNILAAGDFLSYNGTGRNRIVRISNTISGGSGSTGVSKSSFASEIKLFPNPSEDYFHIELGSIYDKISVEVSDVMGRPVYSAEYQQQRSVDLNLIKVPNGIYIISLSSKDARTILRVVKE